MSLFWKVRHFLVSYSLLHILNALSSFFPPPIYHCIDELVIRLTPLMEEISSISWCIAIFFCFASIIMSKSRFNSFAIFKKRSEEHTSELQSRENLVCRLLLEKKKKNK